MNILFYCPWHNQKEWLKKLKKRFKDFRIFTLDDKPDYKSIDYALIWNLDNKILKKIKNVKILFSLGAGVDHILKLKSYRKQPIIRIKDTFMAERMSNYVLSQILNYQLNLKYYFNQQLKKNWGDELEPVQNNKLQIGILGLGFLGLDVAKKLKSLGYKVVGFKNTKPKFNYSFPVFYKKNDLIFFLNHCDVLITILPATPKTYHYIDSNFLNQMKKKALLINAGRGSVVNERNLISHLNKNKYFNVSLDVFESEPLKKNSPFWQMKNTTVTPHIASLTFLDSAIDSIYKKILEHKKNGRIQSDVDLKKGY